MKGRKKIILATILLLAIVAVAFSASYVKKYQIQRPSSITVIPSTWKIGIFTDSLCTINATQISFSNLEESSGLNSSSSTYYMHNIGECRKTYIFWNVSGLPEGWTMYGYYQGRTTEENWAMNSGQLRLWANELSMDGVGQWKTSVHWILDPSPTATEGTYDLNFTLWSSEYIA